MSDRSGETTMVTGKSQVDSEAGMSLFTSMVYHSRKLETQALPETRGGLHKYIFALQSLDNDVALERSM